jgi:hypothetical protein
VTGTRAIHPTPPPHPFPPPRPQPHPPYIFDGSIIEDEALHLVSNFSLPPVFGKEGAHKQFIMGPPRSGAMPHFHGDAVNLLLLGVKLWVLTPPADAAFVDAHAAAWWEDSYLPAHRRGNASEAEAEPAEAAVAGGQAGSLAAALADTAGAGGVGRWHHLAVQGPGDFMYVPTHWGHAVLNLADTFALAYE